MKEQIRINLKMVEDSIPKFNDHSLEFIDKKELRKLISVWRWYISHDYFKEGHVRPTGLYSQPPMGWLQAQLQGQTVPLHRDVAECIAPVVQSGLKTEHSARRIMNALNSIYRHISTEDMKVHSEATYKRKVLDKLDAKGRAEYEKDRRHKKEKTDLQKKLEDPVYKEKMHKKHMKQKNDQRKAAAKKHTLDKADAKRRLKEQLARDKRSGN